jgi:hypothetical protein
LLEDLLDRVPEGWSAVAYAGRRYGLTRTTHTDGRSVSLLAEELGGPDVVSANVFRLSGGAELRPCEMPAAKVLSFLEGWLPLGGCRRRLGRQTTPLISWTLP